MSGYHGMASREIAGQEATPYRCGIMTGSSMHEVPPAERPRERLLNKGADSLRTAELLAILLRTGTRERPVLELADFLLTHFGSLEALSRAPVGELARIKGIGAGQGDRAQGCVRHRRAHESHRGRSLSDRKR